MQRIAPVGLQYNPKTLWFDAGDLEIEVGQPVIVETERGLEFGSLVSDIFEASEEDLEILKSPLKPVIRQASEEDIELAKKLRERSKEALVSFKEIVESSGEEMSPVSVEFLFSEDKAIFYFKSDKRIDFRDLVRKLASHFKVRIDMRQIGVRDEARIVGGLGHCGQELCCKRFGGSFNQVSIKMAKDQDLSLNPAKISGVCGRLMCCLRYEADAYQDCKSRCPKVGSCIKSQGGCCGTVTQIDVLREEVSVALEEEEKQVKIPLYKLSGEDEEGRPCYIEQEVLAELLETEVASNTSASVAKFSTSLFTGTDKLASQGSIRHINEGAHKQASTESSGAPKARKLRTRRSAREQDQSDELPVGSKASAQERHEARRPRRRTLQAAGASEAASAAQGTGYTQERKHHNATSAEQGLKPGRAHRRERTRRLRNHEIEGAEQTNSTTSLEQHGVRSHKLRTQAEQRSSSAARAAREASPEASGRGVRAGYSEQGFKRRERRRPKEGEGSLATGAPNLASGAAGADDARA